jgi:hypothetical protein
MLFRNLVLKLLLSAALEKFRATDPDRGGNSKVTYAIDRASDRRRQFAISEDGTVTIQRALDRETVPTHQVKILAIGESKRTTFGLVFVRMSNSSLYSTCISLPGGCVKF